MIVRSAATSPRARAYSECRSCRNCSPPRNRATALELDQPGAGARRRAHRRERLQRRDQLVRTRHRAQHRLDRRIEHDVGVHDTSPAGTAPPRPVRGSCTAPRRIRPGPMRRRMAPDNAPGRWRQMRQRSCRASRSVITRMSPAIPAQLDQRTDADIELPDHRRTMKCREIDQRPIQAELLDAPAILQHRQAERPLRGLERKLVAQIELSVSQYATLPMP